MNKRKDCWMNKWMKVVDPLTPFPPGTFKGRVGMMTTLWAGNYYFRDLRTHHLSNIPRILVIWDRGHWGKNDHYNIPLNIELYSPKCIVNENYKDVTSIICVKVKVNSLVFSRQERKCLLSFFSFSFLNYDMKSREVKDSTSRNVNFFPVYLIMCYWH